MLLCDDVVCDVLMVCVVCDGMLCVMLCVMFVCEFVVYCVSGVVVGCVVEVVFYLFDMIKMWL